MELYLLRHGTAERHSPSGRDPDRALTPDGIGRLRATLEQARGQGLTPRWIVASPYLRAQQTARIAADVLGYTEHIHVSSRLTPESAPTELWEEVREWDPDSPLLFVAHEPLLSAAASWLLGETRLTVEFRPGTLARIDFDAVGRSPRGALRCPRGALRWKIHAT